VTGVRSTAGTAGASRRLSGCGEQLFQDAGALDLSGKQGTIVAVQHDRVADVACQESD
jgi:hypothetical protein